MKVTTYVIPWYYTTTEGGDWIIYSGQPIDEARLGARAKDWIWANNLKIHALCWGSPISTKAVKWDCINGYRGEFKQGEAV